MFNANNLLSDVSGATFGPKFEDNELTKMCFMFYVIPFSW